MAEPTQWQVLGSQIALDTPWLRVRRDTVRTATGLVMDDYYVVERRDFAMIVALTAENDIILVREYKHGAGQVLLQCPAGYINEHEDPAEAAQRELLEETGYMATGIESLGAYYISTGMVTTRGHLFLCREASLHLPNEERRLDAAEEIAIELIPFEDALQRIASGTLTPDMSTVAAVLRASQMI